PRACRRRKGWFRGLLPPLAQEGRGGGVSERSLRRTLLPTPSREREGETLPVLPLDWRRAADEGCEGVRACGEEALVELGLGAQELGVEGRDLALACLEHGKEAGRFGRRLQQRRR